MTSRQNHTRRNIEIGLHILIWVLIFNIPLLSGNHNLPITFDSYIRSLILPFFFGIVFYTNYLFLIPRLLLPKKLVVFFVANIVLYSTSGAVMEFTRTFFHSRSSTNLSIPHMRDAHGNIVKPLHHLGPPASDMIMRALIAFTMTTGIAVAIRTTKQWFISEDVRKDLEREHLKSELANLKNQLNPHFFFNTLNNIYGLIIQNQEKAQEAVLQLSKLMRYLIYDSNEKYVSLTKEIEFMHHYIDLMKLRVTNNVKVTYAFPKETSGYTIAPLLFISLIENSFKHGISADKPSEIHMDLKITTEKEVVFSIKNTSFPKKDNDRSGSGIGLENLKKRLNLLYANKHSIDVTSDADYYSTILTVKL